MTWKSTASPVVADGTCKSCLHKASCHAYIHATGIKTGAEHQKGSALTFGEFCFFYWWGDPKVLRRGGGGLGREGGVGIHLQGMTRQAIDVACHAVLGGWAERAGGGQQPNHGKVPKHFQCHV